MVEKVNGFVIPGEWFSAGVRFLTVAVDGMTAQTDSGKTNTSLEFVLETLSTRGPIVAFYPIRENTIRVMIDYGQSFDDAAVVAETVAFINAFPGLSNASITVNENIGSPFTIDSLFADGQKGGVYLAGPAYAFTDIAGTIPAGDGDPVAYVTDLSGNGRHGVQESAPRRPILRLDGAGHWYFEFPLNGFDYEISSRFDLDFEEPLVATVVCGTSTGTIAYDIDMSLDFDPGWESGNGFWAETGRFPFGQWVDEYWYNPSFPDFNNRCYGFALVEGRLSDLDVEKTRRYFVEERGAKLSYVDETKFNLFLTGNHITGIRQNTLDVSSAQYIGNYLVDSAGFVGTEYEGAGGSMFGMMHSLVDFDLNALCHPNVLEMQYIGHCFRNDFGPDRGGPIQTLVLNIPNATTVYILEHCKLVIDFSPMNMDDSPTCTRIGYWFDTDQMTEADVSDWDTSNMTTIIGLWWRGSVETADVSDWDVGNAEDLYVLFGESKIFEADVSNWNTSSAISLHSFARNNDNISVLDVSGWDTSNVTEMTFFIRRSPNISVLDVSGWDTSNVTDMYAFASGSTGLLALDVSGWNTANVTSFGFFVSLAVNITTLDISNWDTSSVVGAVGSVNGFSNFAANTALTTLIVNGGTGNPFADSSCVNYRNAFTNTNLTQQSIDDILVRINAAGTSTGLFDQSGGSAPFTTGQAAITALRSRGWTVNVTGGF